eukprot:705746-Pelagomonas_calceolata.AAC.4
MQLCNANHPCGSDTGTLSPGKLSAAASNKGSRIQAGRWSRTANDHMRLPSSRSWNSVKFAYT